MDRVRSNDILTEMGLLQRITLTLVYRLGLVADPVIEAIARPEFEDGLRTGVHHGGCWGP